MNNNILNIDRMNNFIASSTPRIISKIWQFTSEIIWWWMGIPSIEAIDDIQTKIPELNEFIDFDAARSRIPKIPKTNNKSIRWGDVKFEVFFPELIIVRDRFQEAFISVQPGIEKTEAWLYPSALEAGANADLEALIYF
jgi:hypothetical protein